MKTYTKGNIVIEDIKLGDIHYEFGYGKFVKSEVVSLPEKEERTDHIYWKWSAKNLLTGEIIQYGVSNLHAHYGPNLYDHQAYIGCEQI